MRNAQRPQVKRRYPEIPVLQVRVHRIDCWVDNVPVNSAAILHMYGSVPSL